MFFSAWRLSLSLVFRVSMSRVSVARGRVRVCASLLLRDPWLRPDSVQREHSFPELPSPSRVLVPLAPGEASLSTAVVLNALRRPASSGRRVLAGTRAVGRRGSPRHCPDGEHRASLPCV